MVSISNSPEEQFEQQAVNDWDLKRLYKDLASAKRQAAPHKRKGLTAVEKQHLCGLLCGYSPVEIAEKLVKRPRGVEADLCNTVYRYVEQLTTRLPNTVRNWRDIPEWLETAGYKTQSSELLTTEEVIANPNTAVSQADELDLDALVKKVRSHSTDFLGREEAITDLNTFVSQGAKVICIYGKGGVGKTTLAKKYLSLGGFDLVLEPPMAKETKNITPIESVVEELLRDLQGEPAREFGITLKRLKQQLKTQRVGVLIRHLRKCSKAFVDRLFAGQMPSTFLNPFNDFIRITDSFRAKTEKMLTIFSQISTPPS
jgi:hypothetical protein